MKDFLGQEYGPGDYVVYGASSGRSINMVYGQVLSVGATVKIQPLSSSRWQQHYARPRYIDTRTGKGVNPYHHVKRKSHYQDPNSDQTLSYEDYYLGGGVRLGWTYVTTEFEDYIERVTEEVKPVTIKVTANIVKVPQIELEEECSP